MFAVHCPSSTIRDWQSTRLCARLTRHNAPVNRREIANLSDHRTRILVAQARQDARDLDFGLITEIDKWLAYPRRHEAEKAKGVFEWET
jgi:hypothetical protein